MDLNYAKEAFKYSDKKIIFKLKTKDGKKVNKGKVVAVINGKTKSILKSERVALNFIKPSFWSSNNYKKIC